jgi:CheY-like chemotaxis protein
VEYATAVVSHNAPPFSFSFKRREEANRRRERERQENQGRSSESLGEKIILIVEDNPDGRVILTDMLLLLGYEVVSASNGREALDLLKQGPLPSLILLDLSMPEMNGWEFRERQKREPAWADIPVIVMSAVATRSEAERSGLEAAAFLDKPVPPTMLVELIRKLV